METAQASNVKNIFDQHSARVKARENYTMANLHTKAAELLARIAQTGVVNGRDCAMAGIFATQLERRHKRVAGSASIA